VEETTCVDVECRLMYEGVQFIGVVLNVLRSYTYTWGGTFTLKVKKVTDPGVTCHVTFYLF